MYKHYHFRKITNFSFRKHLALLLLFPLVDYCSLVFCNLSDERNLKLESVIKTRIWYIYGIRKSSHISPFRRKLCLLRVVTRREFRAGCLLYKLLKKCRPAYLANYFLARTDQLSSRRDRAKTLVIPRANKEFLRRLLHVSISFFWISFLFSITTSFSLSISKLKFIITLDRPLIKHGLWTNLYLPRFINV